MKVSFLIYTSDGTAHEKIADVPNIEKELASMRESGFETKDDDGALLYFSPYSIVKIRAKAVN